MPEHREFYRRHLPHWQPAGATLFITFRLAGSLPRPVVAALKEERELEERAEKAHQDARRASGRWDAALDIWAAGPRSSAETRAYRTALLRLVVSVTFAATRIPLIKRRAHHLR